MNNFRGALMAPISRKRKDREEFFVHPPAHSHTNNSRGKMVQSHRLYHNTTSLKTKPGEPGWSNRLLAGYMAHEFLTQGTLLGQILYPARAEAVPVSAQQPGPSRDNGGGASSAAVAQEKTYGEVSRLVKAEGAHIDGIVNPTQLARWIQM